MISLEGLLSVFHVESQGAGVTLASSKWMEKFWRPVNELGYRDANSIHTGPQGRRVLWVVGDSHAAGWGIANLSDRLTDRLANALGSAWVVYTIAKPGWDTRRQIENAARFPHPPDAVVHLYCLNDAERAAGDLGVVPDPALRDPEGRQLQGIWARSYLADFLVTRWRGFDARRRNAEYWEFIERCFDSPVVWDAHASDIASLIDAYRRFTSAIVTIIIPNLTDPHSSRRLVSKVAGEFERRGVTTIDLAETLIAKPIDDLIINRFDAHASPQVHEIMATRALKALHVMTRSADHLEESALSTVLAVETE